MKHVGASLRGRAWNKWYTSLAMIWPKHIEGGLASQDLIDHIDAGKCDLRVRRVIYKALKIVNKIVKIAFSTTGPCLFLPDHLSRVSQRKTIGPCQYIHYVLKL